MLKYLINQSRVSLAAASLVTVFHGACSVLLVAQISSALTAAEPERGTMAMIFIATAIAVMLSYVGAAILF